ncbi:MAG TPA: hypothetical protein VNZ22_08745 [Bacillota bacterium]|nr:hypothetical protein [Bacillota bacterium]
MAVYRQGFCNGPDHVWRPNRREFLFVGLVGSLGLTLGSAFRLQAQSAAAKARAQSVLNIFLPGGIAAAQRQIEALQGQGNSEPSQLAALNSQLSTLRAAPALSAAYHLRERLTAKKREQEKVVAALETQRQLLRKAEQELAAARQAAGKAEDQIKSAKAEVSRTEPTANQMAADLQAEQSRLEALLQQYRSALAGSNTPPKQ